MANWASAELGSEGGGGGNSLRPYSQQRPMRTNLAAVWAEGICELESAPPPLPCMQEIENSLQGGGGGNSLRPYSQQRPMRTNLS